MVSDTALGYDSPLKSVIEKGMYEKTVTIGGDEILMHISTVKDEREVNQAIANVDLLSRDYERWVHRMSRMVTRINSKILDQKEAIAFFGAMSEVQFEQFVDAYEAMRKEVISRFKQNIQEIKN